MKLKRYLVVQANGEIKVRQRKPQWNDISYDQFLVPLTVNIPDGWGSVLTSSEITVDLPAPPDVHAEIELPDNDEDEPHDD